MRKINLRLLVWIMGGAIVLTAVVFAIHAFQYQRLAGALLWQARRAEEQGQTPRMVRYLQRYLEFAPRDLDEKVRLARACATGWPGCTPKLRSNGLNLLDIILIAEPQRSDLRRLLVKTALVIGKPKMARDHLKVLWAAANTPDTQTPGATAGTDVSQRGELECYWGQLAEAESAPEQALSWYRQAVQHAPQEQLSFLRLAYLLRTRIDNNPAQRQRDEAEADQLLDELVTRNDTSAQAHLARWNYRRHFDLVAIETHEPGAPATGHKPGEKKRVVLRGTSRDATEDVTRALQRDPEAIEVLLAAADLQSLLRHQGPAREYLERGLDLLNKQAAQDKKGKAASPQGGALTNGAAATEAPITVALSPDQARYQLLWHLTNLLLDVVLEEKKAPEARETEGKEIVLYINQLRRFKNSGAAADYLEGRLRLLERRWAEAVALLERARPALASQGDVRALVNQIDIFLGQCYEQLEEPGQMFAAYQRAHEFDPNSPVALLGMGSALWLQGRLDDAMGYYQKVMNLKQVPLDGWVDVARLEIQRQLQRESARRDWADAESALAKAEKALADGDTSRTVHLRESSGARALDITLLRTELRAAQGRAREAEDLLKLAREDKANKDPAHQAQVWAALARLALRANDRPRVLALLDEADQKLGFQIELRLARIRFWAYSAGPGTKPESATQTQEKRDLALKHLRKLEDAPRELDLPGRARLLDELAEAYFRIGSTPEAQRVCEQLAQHPEHQSDLRLRLLLFDLALASGNDDKMLKTLEEIQTVERTQGVFWRYGQALRLLWQAGHGRRDKDTAVKEARGQLDRVARLRPNWPAVSLARAQICELEGNTDGLINELRQALNQGEGSPAVIRQLVVALNARQRYQEADQEMRKLRQSLLVNSELGRLAATTTLRNGNPARALQLARDAVASDTRDWRELLWLARMCEANPEDKEAKEAENKLRQAVALVPAEPEPVVALVRFLAGRKRQAEAEVVWKEARPRIDPKHRDLAAGQCYESLGLWKEARSAYEKALQEQPGNTAVRRILVGFNVRSGRRGEAEKLLRLMVRAGSPATTGATQAREGDTQPPNDDVAWGRRSLAMLLADGNDYTRFQEALELVGVKVDGNGRPVKEPASAPARTSPERTDPEAIRAQARVLATQDQRPWRERAFELFDQLARTQNLTTEDQFVLAVLLEQSGNWPKAREQLLALVGRPLPRPEYLVMLARGLIREKEFDEAERWVKKLEQMEKQQDVSTGTFATVELRALLLEGGNKGERAVTLLEEYNRRKGAQPEDVLLVFGSLARQKRFDRSFDMLETIWEKCRPEAASAASVSLLRQMKASDEQCLKIENWIKAALAKEPGKMVLRMHLADLYDLRGRYPEAEEVLRTILKPENEPNNVVALNNLAWLLARHKDPQQANQGLSYINTAVKGVGKRPELLDTRAIVYLALGRTEDALADLQEVITEAPSASRLFHMARAQYRAGERDTAVKILRKARTLGLDPEALHPTEQEDCQKLLAELKVK